MNHYNKIESFIRPLDDDDTTPKVVQHLYSSWADSYDKDLAAVPNGYRAPLICAQFAAKYVEDKSAPLLDLGCGTGLSGIPLQALGFTNIDGLDGSEEMVEKAREKGIYKRLFVEFIDESGISSVERGHYSCITVVGSFVPAHLGPQHVAGIVAALRPGGIFCNITRVKYLERKWMAGMSEEMQRLVDEGVWERLEETQVPGYMGNDAGFVHVYRKL